MLYIFSKIYLYICNYMYICNYIYETEKSIYIYIYIYIPTPPLGQDMTQGQFLSGV